MPITITLPISPTSSRVASIDVAYHSSILIQSIQRSNPIQSVQSVIRLTYQSNQSIQSVQSVLMYSFGLMCSIGLMCPIEPVQHTDPISPTCRSNQFNTPNQPNLFNISLRISPQLTLRKGHPCIYSTCIRARRPPKATPSSLVSLPF